MQRLLALALALSTSACLFQEVTFEATGDASSHGDSGAPDDVTGSAPDAGGDATTPPDVAWADATAPLDATSSDADTDAGEVDPGGIVRSSAGLVSHYVFKEGRNDLVRTGAAFANSVISEGMLFGYAAIPRPGDYEDVLESDHASLELFVRADGAGHIFQCGDRLVLSADSEPVVTGYYRVTLLFGREVQVLGAMPDDTSTHIALVRDGRSVRLYVRGALVSAFELPQDGTAATCTLGGGEGGMLFESIALYDRVLSPAEVAMHTAAGPIVAPMVDRELTNLAVRVQALDGTTTTGAESTVVTIQSEVFDAQQGGDFGDLARVLMSLAPIGGAAGVPGTVQSARLYLFGDLPQKYSGTLWVHPLLRAWNENATWGSTGTASWESGGAKGNSDRAPSIGDVEVAEGELIVVDLDVTSLLQQWVGGSLEDNGVMLVCDACYGGLIDDPKSAARPTMVTLSNATRPAPPEPPNVSGGSTIWSWDSYSGPVDVEVYQNGFLVGRTAGNQWENKTTVTTPLTFVAVDAWGQASAPVQQPIASQ